MGKKKEAVTYGKPVEELLTQNSVGVEQVVVEAKAVEVVEDATEAEVVDLESATESN